MKNKFVLAVLAVVLIMALVSLALPGMTPMAAFGTGDEVATAAAIDLPAATPQSGAVSIIDGNTAPATTSAGIFMLIVLGASLVIIAVVLRRGLNFTNDTVISPRSMFNRFTEGADKGWRPRDCILPAAA